MTACFPGSTSSAPDERDAAHYQRNAEKCPPEARRQQHRKDNGDTGKENNPADPRPKTAVSFHGKASPGAVSLYSEYAEIPGLVQTEKVTERFRSVTNLTSYFFFSQGCSVFACSVSRR